MSMYRETRLPNQLCGGCDVVTGSVLFSLWQAVFSTTLFHVLGLGMEPRAPCMPSTWPTTDLPFQPNCILFCHLCLCALCLLRSLAHTLMPSEVRRPQAFFYTARKPGASFVALVPKWKTKWLLNPHKSLLLIPTQQARVQGGWGGIFAKWPLLPQQESEWEGPLVTKGGTVGGPALCPQPLRQAQRILLCLGGWGAFLKIIDFGRPTEPHPMSVSCPTPAPQSSCFT